MANNLDIEHLPVEGVHILNDDNYRDYRHNAHVALQCENCGKKKGDDGVAELKRCAGCYKVAFCSRECQKTLWPTHKADCKTMQEGRFIAELVQNFYSNPLLLRMLRAAIVLRLGLQNSAAPVPQTSIPFIVVHLHIVPLSEADKEKLVHKQLDAAGKERIPGYLEVGINNETPDYIPIARTPAEERQLGLNYALYKQARRHADEHGREGNPIVFVAFGHGSSSMLSAIEITPDAFEIARGNYSSLSPLLQQLIPDVAGANPVGVRTLLAVANTFIQLDLNDELRLRRDMTQADKTFVRDTGRMVAFGEKPPAGRYSRSA
ncbi:hypothetical protein D9613_012435 [Agrocybe pediades]|uniref:MYND-type domain-containing protein n=1 Tax=Agrocybe pediades TaxID=84607 RepID=A0A8H4VQ01_9AGAR|nr:hypothetical protein D9613_012435 [Agrocybe pediades]